MPALVESVTDLSRTPGVRACSEWFRKERAWINEQHLRLPHPRAHLPGTEARGVDGREISHIGLGCELDRAGNVIASLPGRREGPSVAVTAHLDTVLAPRVPEDVKNRPATVGCRPGRFRQRRWARRRLLALAGAWTAWRLPLKIRRSRRF